MSRYVTETPWDIKPDSTSIFQIYDPADHYLVSTGVDVIQKYDGDNVTNLEGNPPKGNILAVYKDRLLVTGDTSFPHRIWYSHIRNGEGWTLDTDWLEVYPEDGGKINGLEIQGDELVISKDNGRLYGWLIYADGDPVNSRLRIIEDDKGAVNKNAMTVLDDIAYYLDRERLDTIPVQTRGGLSYVVGEVIEGVQTFVNANIGSNDGKVFVALGNVTIDIGDEVPLTNAVLVYDTITQGFYVRDNIDARVFSKFISGESEDLYFGDGQGKVFKLDDGNTAGGNPVHMRLRSKPFFREKGENISIRKVGIFMDDPDGTVVNYRTHLNRKFSRNLGTVTEEPVQWFEVDVTGPLFQLEFTHSNTKSRPRLLAIDIDYAEQGKSE